MKTETDVIANTGLVKLSVDNIVVDSDHTMVEAADLLRALKTQKAQDLEVMAEITGVKRLKEVYDKAKEKVDKVEKIYSGLRTKIEKKMSDYVLKREQSRKEYEEKLRAEHEYNVNHGRNQAEILRAMGKNDAAAVAEAIANMPIPILPDPKLHLNGVVVVDDYDVRITDLKAFIQGVAAGAIPLSGVVMKKETYILDVRESVVKAYARLSNGKIEWPGVEITRKASFRVSEED